MVRANFHCMFPCGKSPFSHPVNTGKPRTFVPVAVADAQQLISQNVPASQNEYPKAWVHPDHCEFAYACGTAILLRAPGKLPTVVHGSEVPGSILLCNAAFQAKGVCTHYLRQASLRTGILPEESAQVSMLSGPPTDSFSVLAYAAAETVRTSCVRIDI
jgi:hypothetical protein